MLARLQNKTVDNFFSLLTSATARTDARTVIQGPGLRWQGPGQGQGLESQGQGPGPGLKFCP